jgi:hypothetical protein
VNPKNISVEGWVAILSIFVTGSAAFAAVKSDITVLQHDISEIRDTQLTNRAEQSVNNEKIDKLFELFYTSKQANRAISP